jgi:cell division protease FtsH
MIRDAWLPIGHPLPDGSKTKTVLQEGINWQIVGIQGGGRALIVREALVRRWLEAGLLEAARFGSFSFGQEALFGISFPERHIVASVSDGRSPNNKAEALAFATALKATRAIDHDSPLQDAIYVEPLSRLLPTYTITSRTDDAIVVGFWLTGGAPISATSFRRLCQALSWLAPRDVKDVVLAAGFVVHEAVPDDRLPGRASGRENAAKAAVEAPIDLKVPFSLPGRPALEGFLREHVIDIIASKARYQALGIGFPSAIVLHGPPGCGKTFAVERLVEHLGWPSFQIDASSVASPYIHETSRKISEVFKSAAKSAPSVLVIDEMEAFLAERDMGSGNHRVEEVAEFLGRIPEAASSEVLIVAMTNRLDMIDSAILRRGRFDHIIEVSPASEKEVENLLDTLLDKLPYKEDVDASALAMKLTGRPLSDVAFVVREGARLAARAGKDRIAQADLVAALEATPARNQEPERRIGFV